jgi:hypothetical protein
MLSLGRETKAGRTPEIEAVGRTSEQASASASSSATADTEFRRKVEENTAGRGLALRPAVERYVCVS